MCKVQNKYITNMFLLRKLNNLPKTTLKQSLTFTKFRELRTNSKTAALPARKLPTEVQEVQDDIKLPTNELLKNTIEIPSKIPSALSPIDPNDPPDIVPNFVPTFNLAAYVNKSESLQQLLKLGVDLSKIEKRKGLPQFILKLDFDKDMKPHIIFLSDVGVQPANLGEFITKNPLIFKEDLNDLHTRINYLEAKRFRPVDIQRIVTKNPFWLMFTTQRIDKRLGFFQQNFKLSGNEVRFLASKQPRLITYRLEHIKKSIFCIKEEMGFDEDDIKCLLLSKPKLWMLNQDELIERFDYVHKTMQISHDMIIQSPEILTSREFRLKQRHGFLKFLGRAQYDPGKDLYVSLKSLVEGTDRDFVLNVAKSDMKTYDMFLRTL